MPKPKAKVVKRLDWVTVKETTNQWGRPSFDIWQWNIFKMKWVRLSNTACGWSSLADSLPAARQLNSEVQDALDNNRQPPPPIV